VVDRDEPAGRVDQFDLHCGRRLAGRLREQADRAQRARLRYRYHHRLSRRDAEGVAGRLAVQRAERGHVRRCHVVADGGPVEHRAGDGLPLIGRADDRRGGRVRELVARQGLGQFGVPLLDEGVALVAAEPDDRVHAAVDGVVGTVEALVAKVFGQVLLSRVGRVEVLLGGARVVAQHPPQRLPGDESDQRHGGGRAGPPPPRQAPAEPEPGHAGTGQHDHAQTQD